MVRTPIVARFNRDGIAAIVPRHGDGQQVTTVSVGTGIAVLRTPGYPSGEAPRANAICERLIGTVRRAWRDHLLVMSDMYLRRVLARAFQCSNTML